MKALKTAIIISCIFPYVVAFAPNPGDTSLTALEFVVGKGSYADVSRDCSGKVRTVQSIPFTEVGGRATHQISWFKFGLSAGYMSNWRQTSSAVHMASSSGNLTYVAPLLGINTKSVGLETGYLYPLSASPDHGTPGYHGSQPTHNGFLTAMLRLGNRDAWFLSASFANNIPLAAGGGLFDLGLGFTGNKPHSLYWIGLGGGPYDGIALSLKGDFPLSTNFVLSTRAQVASRDAFEYGLAVGGKIIF